MTNGAPSLEERLHEPQTVEKLNHLLDRLDTIERAVDALERLEHQLPMAMSTAADVLDDELTRAAERGVVLDERAGEALRLAEKLTEPKTVETLTRLIDRLDRIEQIADLADHVPGAAAMTVDTLDEALTRAADRGVVLDERVREGLMLLETLTEPKTAQALGELAGRTDQIAELAKLAEHAPQAIATVVDILDSEYARAMNAGFDPERALRDAASALGKLSEVFRTDEFRALLDSGVLDPEALRVIGSLGTALVESQKEASRGETPERGMFGLLRALRDPDVQHAVGFLTSFAKRFGRQLRS
ncbi:hypothetical protein CRI94_06965 [Longibacter salinarum]|uniref:DUF1641 domain-containing protein n=2 Tax=Longibacter salinarum TaxID=1850348 RepID=A0A2A8CZK7_9BACT|nr:hypothetical protein CRI94_06965 [Longibacter salinarum]